MGINIINPLLILESCCPWPLNSLVLCPALLHVLVITFTVHDCIPDGFSISGTAYLSAYQFLDWSTIMGQSIFQPIRFEVYPAAPRVNTSLSLLISKRRGTLHFNLGIQNFVSHPPPHTIGFFWAASINTFFFPFFFFFFSVVIV